MDAFLHYLVYTKKLFSQESLLKYLTEFQENQCTTEKGTQLLFSQQNLFSTEFPSNSSRYNVLETIGEGGMGVIQRAEDRFLGRKVALKRIKTKSSKTLSKKQAGMLWRLKREASLTAILEHPNIVPLHDIQELANGELYFTMREVKGETLNEILKKRGKGKFSENHLLSIFFKVCDAVSYAHSQGIIHRDLKPENIMVGEFGEVYVMDWGIAKEITTIKTTSLSQASTMLASAQNEKKITTIQQEKTLPAKLSNETSAFFETVGGMGTPGYMAPEQELNAQNATPQSDIYALGKILRQCFTLLSPMEEMRLKIKYYEQQYNLAASSTEPLPKIPEIPLDIHAISQKATQEKPFNRYESVQEFVQDMERYQQHMRVSVRKYHWFELLQKWRQRNKIKIIMGVIIFSLAMIFILYFQWLRIQEQSLQFQQAYQKSSQEKQIASQIQFSGKPDQAQKMKHFFYALNFINRALSIYPKDPKALQKKYEISKALIFLACNSQDFQFAEFIARELEKTPEFSHYSSFFPFVEKARTKTLTKHLARFHHLKNKLKSASEQPGERVDAIFEISKMEEEEIFQQLLQIQQKGLSYFLKKEQAQTSLDEYYNTMVEILGRLENPKAARSLAFALKKMAQKLKTNSPEKHSVREFSFTVKLAEALGNTTNAEYAPVLKQLRWQMGQNKLFWNRTQISYKKLLRYGNLTQQKLARAIDYNERGLAKKEKGDIEGAIKDYTEALMLDPKLVSAYNNRGLAKQEKDFLLEALEDFSKAIQLEPETAYFYNNRGRIYANMKDFDRAFKDYNQAISLDPFLEEAYSNRGLVKMYLGRLEEAIQEFTFIISLNQQNTWAYNNRGIARKRNKELSKALEDFSKAIELDPKFISAYNNRGTLYGEQKKYEAALQDFNQAIRLNPQNTNSYLNRGMAKYNLKDYQGALLDYDFIIERHPNNSSAYLKRGLVRENLNNINGALSDLNKSIQLNPNNSIAYSNRGMIHIKRQKIKEALQDLNKAIQLKPQNPLAYNNRGAAKEALKEYSAAIEDYSRAIQLDPNFAEAFDNRGVIKRKTKDLAGSLLDLNKAIQLNPNNSNFYNNRGNTKRIQGDLNGALIDFQKATQLQPNFPFALYNIGLTAQQLKKTDLSLEAFEKGLNLAPNPNIKKTFLKLLLIRIRQNYRQKNFSKLQKDLLRFKKFAPKNHSKLPQIEKLLQQLKRKK